MRSVLMIHSAISRWILRNEELASASLSNAETSFVYATRCTLQRAHIIMRVLRFSIHIIVIHKF
ncbi:MAG: hypothetical protein E7071_01035 [Bacteroidales bacterium]|nr:hypothetical protein [Bacteroidales bacterium]